ncbi:hypothetical protein J6590_016638 [Homalodisca vitripennis]|nr:hypothetical protein J6590_016638 [Homalodisca vitripennis]
MRTKRNSQLEGTLCPRWEVGGVKKTRGECAIEAGRAYFCRGRSRSARTCAYLEVNDPVWGPLPLGPDNNPDPERLDLFCLDIWLIIQHQWWKLSMTNNPVGFPLEHQIVIIKLGYLL